MANKEYCFDVLVTGWVSVLVTTRAKTRAKAKALERLETILQDQVFSQPIGDLRQKTHSVELLGCDIDPKPCCCPSLVLTMVDNCSDVTANSNNDGCSRKFIFDVKIGVWTTVYVKARSKPEALRRLDAKLYGGEVFSMPIRELGAFSHLTYSRGYKEGH